LIADWFVVQEKPRFGGAFHLLTLASHLPHYGGCREDQPRQEKRLMSDEHPKTPIDHIGDTLAQLKEMRHYSKNNVEALTASWLLYDGELSKLKQADRIANLMDQQNKLHDALETTIAELEDVLEKMQPPPEE
jgi:hypothetical protein